MAKNGLYVAHVPGNPLGSWLLEEKRWQWHSEHRRPFEWAEEGATATSKRLGWRHLESREGSLP